MQKTFEIKNKATAEHYNWGHGCDGWHLLKDENLSVIHEFVPPGKSEIRHHHEKSRQMFFILKGQASIEIDGEEFILKETDSIEVPPLVPHQLFNKTNANLEFLVISQPPSHGDRIVE